MMKKAVLWGVAVVALLALIGCSTDDNSSSSSSENTPTAITLKVTGIPSSAGIFAGTLLDGTFTPLAAAMNNNGSFTFSVFLGIEEPNPLGGKFDTLGEYYIILADTMTGTGTNYIYVVDTEVAPGVTMQVPAQYNFESLDAVTLPWSDFKNETLFPK